MAAGAGKVAAQGVLDTLKAEMQGFQVSADKFKKANAAFKKTLEDKDAAALLKRQNNKA